MKLKMRVIILLLFSCKLLFADTQQLGKTHFIVGYTPAQSEPKEEIQQRPHDPNTPSWLCTHDVCHAFFSASDDIHSILIDLIAHEQKAIKITMFMFTDKEIAQALLDARARGVSVEIIADSSSAKDRFSKIPFLKQEGIPSYEYCSSDQAGLIADCMHHKFVIFEKNYGDKAFLWTGSFNFTKNAAKNQENVLITDNKNAIQQYREAL